MIEGVMCTLALTAAGGLLGLDLGNLAPAAFLGLLVGLFAVLGAKAARNAVSGACGALGSIAAFIELDSAAVSGANVPLTLAWGALVVLVAGFAGLHPVVSRGGNPLLLPLALFGALKMLSFFVLPFGISLDRTTSLLLALGISLLAAVLVGALVGYVSELGLFVFAFGIGAAMLGAQTAVGTCSDGPELSGGPDPLCASPPSTC